MVQKSIPNKLIIETLLEIDSVQRIALFFDTKDHVIKKWLKIYNLKCKHPNFWVKQRTKPVDKKDLQFNCPICDKERFYPNKDKKHYAQKKNTLCYSCKAKYVPSFNKPKLNKKKKILKTKEEISEINRQRMIKLYQDPNSVWGSGEAKRKSQQSIINKINNDPEFKKSLLNKLKNAKRKTGSSRLEENFYDNIKHLGFLSKQNIADYEVDIVHNKYKLAIEVYGNFWHANPLIYKSNDLINIKKCKTAQDIWDRDNKRINKIKNAGYEVLIFWEKDILSKNNYIETISNFIKEKFEKE